MLETQDYKDGIPESSKICVSTHLFRNRIVTDRLAGIRPPTAEEIFFFPGITLGHMDEQIGPIFAFSENAEKLILARTIAFRISVVTDLDAV